MIFPDMCPKPHSVRQLQSTDSTIAMLICISTLIVVLSFLSTLEQDLTFAAIGMGTFHMQLSRFAAEEEVVANLTINVGVILVVMLKEALLGKEVRLTEGMSAQVMTLGD